MTPWAALVGGLTLSLVALLYKLRKSKKSEERFRLIAQHSSDLVVLHHPDGRWIWASPSVEKILGYTQEELVGRDPYEFFHPEDRKRVRESSHAPVLTKKVGASAVHMTYRMMHKDGHYIWLETLTAPVTVGGRVRKLVTASRDVTRRKEAEDLYLHLIRNLPNTSVLLFDRKFRHLVAEGSLLRNTILSDGESAEGKNLWNLFPEDMAATLAPSYQSTIMGRPTKKIESFRTRVYEIHFLPVHDTSTSFVRAGMAVFADITEEQARMFELEVRTADLERSNRDLEQFANVASHELKSPLRRISGFIQILREDYGNLSEEADEYMNHVLQGVESLKETIDSLLVYSRVQTDRTNMTWVSPEKVVKKAVRHLEAQIKERGAKIYAEPFPEQVTGDEILLGQLFENLIGNAIKFNTTGRRPEVGIRCTRTLTDWEFAVGDNGPGLDPSYQEKVFTMFKRLHPDVEGTGIGLALCKKIVDIHRGKLWFESEGGAGTTFKFTLPARSPEEITGPGR